MDIYIYTYIYIYIFLLGEGFTRKTPKNCSTMGLVYSHVFMFVHVQYDSHDVIFNW